MSASLRLDVLRSALALPGFDAGAAQRIMAPGDRPSAPRAVELEPPREAAALLYVFECAGQLRFPLTRRRADLPEHGGQVSLPGGRPEPGETSWETAVREAFEEIGLPRRSPRSVGALAPVYIPVTHTRLTVHVAVGPTPDAWQAEAREVAEIGEVALDALLDPAHRRVETWTRSGTTFHVPSFHLAGWTVWGATAIALSDLAERLRAVLA